MRSLNLHTIRSRVERLAAELPSEATIYLSWEHGDTDTCPVCGCDLLAYVWNEARKRPVESGTVFVFVKPTHALAACPECGVPTPAWDTAVCPAPD